MQKRRARKCIFMVQFCIDWSELFAYTRMFTEDAYKVLCPWNSDICYYEENRKFRFLDILINIHLHIFQNWEKSPQVCQTEKESPFPPLRIRPHSTPKPRSFINKLETPAEYSLFWKYPVIFQECWFHFYFHSYFQCRYSQQHPQ